MPTSLPSTTVTILTFNGEKYLDSILTAVEGQRYDGPVEVLVLDSGSTDGTLSIVERHPSVRLHEIPNSEFGHGKTRNLAAELAAGEIVVYLTHDAVPAHDRWLAEIVAPFVDDSRVSAVLGKQIARADAPPVIKYDIRRVFQHLGPDHAVGVVYDTGRAITDSEKQVATFYSDANSAARREVLLGPVPYRDVSYAEDQVFGRDLFESGHRRAYAPQALVVHSNDLTLATFGGRIVDEVEGLRRIGSQVNRMSWGEAFLRWVKWSAADTAHILADSDYSRGQKLRWLVVNPWYQAAKWRAFRRAANA